MQFGKRWILIVDGDPGWRLAVFRALAPHGYELVEAEPVEEHLRAATGRRYDLVLGRLAYPELEGWRVCRLLRSIRDPNHAPAPVVLLSDSVTDEEAQLLTASFGGHLVAVPAAESPRWAEGVAEAAGRHLNRTGAENQGGGPTFRLRRRARRFGAIT